MLDRPVAVTDRELADVSIPVRFGGARDVVDPFGARRSRFEIEEHVVGDRPERSRRLWEERLQSLHGLEAASQAEEQGKVLGDHPPHGRLVRVAVDAFVAPALERGVPTDAERLRAREPHLEQVGLDSLDGVKRIDVLLHVDLKRDPRAVAEPQAEERSDADLEGEAVDGLGTDLANRSPDLIRVVGVEDRALDRSVGPNSLGDELAHAKRLTTRGSRPRGR